MDINNIAIGDFASHIYTVDSLPIPEKLLYVCEHPELFDFFKDELIIWFLKSGKDNQTYFRELSYALYHQDNAYILKMLDCLTNYNQPLSLTYLMKYNSINLMRMNGKQFVTYALIELIKHRTFYYHEFKETHTEYLLNSLEKYILFIDVLEEDYEEYVNAIKNQSDDLEYRGSSFFATSFNLFTKTLPSHFLKSYVIAERKHRFETYYFKFLSNETINNLVSPEQFEMIFTFYKKYSVDKPLINEEFLNKNSKLIMPDLLKDLLENNKDINDYFIEKERYQILNHYRAVHTEQELQDILKDHYNELDFTGIFYKGDGSNAPIT